MLNFSCTNCNHKFTVPEIHAGKKGKCHKCGSVIVIPAIQTDAPSTDIGIVPAQEQQNSFSPILEPSRQQEELKEGQSPPVHGFHPAQNPESVISMDNSQRPPAKPLPWIFEIFLYPISTPGLINLCVYWLLPVLLGLIQMLLPIRYVFSLVNLVIIGSLFYYLMECIRDSARGGKTAPDNMTSIPEIRDAITQFMEIVACLVLFWGPVAFYFMFGSKMDMIFWLLLGYGVFFFPIGFLSLAMFNSTSAFNPFLWISSICSTFLNYCGVVLMFCLLAGLFGRIVRGLSQTIVLSLLYSFFFIYLSMVACHVLGYFYYHNSKKLNWEV